MSADKLQLIMTIVPVFAVIGIAIAASTVLNTWLRIRNGYPLESQWGKPIYPKADGETVERVRLLTQENAQLRAELGAIKDRLVSVERIVTDGGVMLSHEIDRLRDRAN